MDLLEAIWVRQVCIQRHDSTLDVSDYLLGGGLAYDAAQRLPLSGNTAQQWTEAEAALPRVPRAQVSLTVMSTDSYSGQALVRTSFVLTSAQKREAKTYSRRGSITEIFARDALETALVEAPIASPA